MNTPNGKWVRSVLATQSPAIRLASISFLHAHEIKKRKHMTKNEVHDSCDWFLLLIAERNERLCHSTFMIALSRNSMALAAISVITAIYIYGQSVMMIIKTVDMTWLNHCDRIQRNRFRNFWVPMQNRTTMIYLWCKYLWLQATDEATDEARL